MKNYKLIAIVSMLFMRCAAGQVVTSSVVIQENTVSKNAALPQFVVYRHFLGWVNALDNQAQKQTPSDPYAFAAPFADRTGLTHRHLDSLRNEAHLLTDDLKRQDSKAATVVAAYRQELVKAKQSGKPLPALPAQLNQLQQERDTLIKAHIFVLQAALGSDGSARLDQYVKYEISPHVSWKPLTNARVHNPVAGAPAPFPNGTSN